MPRLTEQEQQEIIRYIEADNTCRTSTVSCCSSGLKLIYIDPPFLSGADYNRGR